MEDQLSDLHRHQELSILCNLDVYQWRLPLNYAAHRVHLPISIHERYSQAMRADTVLGALGRLQCDSLSLYEWIQWYDMQQRNSAYCIVVNGKRER
jgi:hypothetical protein